MHLPHRFEQEPENMSETTKLLLLIVLITTSLPERCMHVLSNSRGQCMGYNIIIQYRTSIIQTLILFET